MLASQVKVVMDNDTLAREAAQLSPADEHALLDRIVDALTSTASHG